MLNNQMVNESKTKRTGDILRHYWLKKAGVPHQSRRLEACAWSWAAWASQRLRCNAAKLWSTLPWNRWDNETTSMSTSVSKPRNQRSSWGMSSHLPRVCVRNLSGITRIRLEVAGSLSLLVCLYNPIQISYSPNWARHKYWDMARKYEPRFLAVSGTVLNRLTGSEIWSHTHISSAFLNQIEIW